MKNTFCRFGIGLLIPAGNVVMEGECHRMAPKNVEIFSTRLLPLGSKPTDILYEAVRKEVEDIPNAAARIRLASPDVVAYGCTSGSFLEGESWNQEVSNTVKKYTQTPVVTASSAVLRALKALQMERIAVATPYPKEINHKLEIFFSSKSLQIVRIGSVCYEEARSELAAYRLAKDLDGKDVDGIFISCTDFRAVHILESLEDDLGKPVISSNQAILWACLRLGGIHDKIQGFGTLFLKP